MTTEEIIDLIKKSSGTGILTEDKKKITEALKNFTTENFLELLSLTGDKESPILELLPNELKRDESFVLAILKKIGFTDTNLNKIASENLHMNRDFIKKFLKEREKEQMGEKLAKSNLLKTTKFESKTEKKDKKHEAVPYLPGDSPLFRPLIKPENSSLRPTTITPNSNHTFLNKKITPVSGSSFLDKGTLIPNTQPTIRTEKNHDNRSAKDFFRFAPDLYKKKKTATDKNSKEYADVEEALKKLKEKFSSDIRSNIQLMKPRDEQEFSDMIMSEVEQFFSEYEKETPGPVYAYPINQIKEAIDKNDKNEGSSLIKKALTKIPQIMKCKYDIQKVYKLGGKPSQEALNNLTGIYLIPPPLLNAIFMKESPATYEKVTAAICEAQLAKGKINEIIDLVKSPPTTDKEALFSDIPQKDREYILKNLSDQNIEPSKEVHTKCQELASLLGIINYEAFYHFLEENLFKKEGVSSLNMQRFCQTIDIYNKEPVESFKFKK